MSRQRAYSNVDGSREPHSVSLKVLRLSRPGLTEQHLLPPHTSSELPDLPPEAGSAFPGGNTNDRFVVTPLVSLPPSFGAAYVGQAFSCTLCANNELGADGTRGVASVRVVAEMQTPSQTIQLDLLPSDEDDEGQALRPGRALQKIVQHELKEEGNHVLAVTVTYSETSAESVVGESSVPTSGRVRTFRKLYQFVAQQCLTVRTKAGELDPVRQETEATATVAEVQLQRFVLEAQLENLSASTLVLENVSMVPKPPFRTDSLNWDVSRPDGEMRSAPTLHPRDVTQVAFLIQEQQIKSGTSNDFVQKESLSDGRIFLGQLSIEWRGEMGDRGSLSTGWLTSRRP